MGKPIQIPHEYEPVAQHTDTEMFCPDLSCDCHEDSENIALVADDVQSGLLTPAEADRYYRYQYI